jgi:ribonuclease HI
VSPITEAWRNLGISSVDLDPVHRFAQPGLRPRDLFPGHIVLDIVKPPTKADKDHKEFMAERNRHLAREVDAASHSPQRVCIVTDASTPPLPLQSVAAYRVWWEGDLYTDWRSAGLATSDDAELQAIAAGVDQAYDIGLEDIHQVHLFSDSTNVLRLCMDTSHHSGQPASLAICRLLVPWLKQHANNTVHLHHITPGVELEDHQLVHTHATSTRVEAGGEPTISADFARREAVSCMLSGWNALFRTKKYVGSNFLPLYQGKNTLLVPTHVNSGPWMRRTGHSHELTARLVRCITRHAPIGSFQSRFFPLESTACRCGLPMETVSHVLYRCPLHEREEEPSEKLPYKWLIDFLITNESAFAFDVH